MQPRRRFLEPVGSCAAVVISDAGRAGDIRSVDGIDASGDVMEDAARKGVPG